MMTEHHLVMSCEFYFQFFSFEQIVQRRVTKPMFVSRSRDKQRGRVGWRDDVLMSHNVVSIHHHKTIDLFASLIETTMPNVEIEFASEIVCIPIPMTIGRLSYAALMPLLHILSESHVAKVYARQKWTKTVICTCSHRQRIRSRICHFSDLLFFIFIIRRCWIGCIADGRWLDTFGKRMDDAVKTMHQRKEEENFQLSAAVDKVSMAAENVQSSLIAHLTFDCACDCRAWNISVYSTAYIRANFTLSFACV